MATKTVEEKVARLKSLGCIKPSDEKNEDGESRSLQDLWEIGNDRYDDLRNAEKPGASAAGNRVESSLSNVSRTVFKSGTVMTTRTGTYSVKDAAVAPTYLRAGAPIPYSGPEADEIVSQYLSLSGEEKHAFGCKHHALLRSRLGVQQG